ncbi:hypothetical protein [Actinoplanes awajinensis]|uniref:Uncharacterized protein n=1 Tax=Actinoplanes awajinensis subsp. mycoplanecinus TaxID=135947 RepID=A0A101J912_9ACTN|nr:hypothetical protein [Actinoplanes awajinensis]KUL22443.1 hypothetical protein ADL15_48845 [Actinoplanes awajinensis subsp. mycoplanecinus]
MTFTIGDGYAAYHGPMGDGGLDCHAAFQIVIASRPLDVAVSPPDIALWSLDLPLPSLDLAGRSPEVAARSLDLTARRPDLTARFPSAEVTGESDHGIVEADRCQRWGESDLAHTEQSRWHPDAGS